MNLCSPLTVPYIRRTFLYMEQSTANTNLAIYQAAGKAINHTLGEVKYMGTI